MYLKGFVSIFLLLLDFATSTFASNVFPRHHKALDNSCTTSSLPVVKFGIFLKIKKQETGNGIGYLLAEYKCQDGSIKHLFCAKRKWIGKKALCESNNHQINYPVYLGKCNKKQKEICGHFCVLFNGEPLCTCPPGFKKEKNHCIDINECEDPIIKKSCKYGCINYKGSYECRQNNDVLSDDPGNDSDDYDEYDEEYDYDPETEDEYNENETNENSIVKENNERNEVTVNEIDKMNKESDDNDDEYDEDYNEEDEDQNLPNLDSNSTTTTSTTSTTTTTTTERNIQITNKIPTIKQEITTKKFEIIYDDDIDDNYIDQTKNNTDDNIKRIDGTLDRNKAEASEDEYDYEDSYDEDYIETTTELMKIITSTEKTTITTNSVIDKNATESINNEDEYDDYDNNLSTTLKISTTIKTPITINKYDEIEEETNKIASSFEPGTFTTKRTNDESINNKTNEDNTEKTNTTLSKTDFELDLNNSVKNDNVDYATRRIDIDLNKEGPNSVETNNDIIKEYDGSDLDNTTIKSVIDENSKLNNSASNVMGNQYPDQIEVTNNTDSDSTTKQANITLSKENSNANNDNITERLDIDLSNLNNTHRDTDDDLQNKEEIDLDRSDENTDVSTKRIAVDAEDITTKKVEEAANKKDPEDSDDDTDNDDDDYDSDDYDSKIEDNKTFDKIDKKCEVGYQMGNAGECVDIDECIPETNPCSDICENTAGSYSCSCPAGFKLNTEDPHTCQDIDECESSPCSHICRNIPGSYRCECPQGLTLQETKCINLTCSQGQTRVNGVLQCTCALGFLLGSDGRSCEDVDECLLEENCAQICTNVIGSYECSCREGYKLEREKYCIDIDECAGLNHGCHQLCENTPGSYKCKCDEGYEFSNGTNTCVDIDECDEKRDMDECNQICINYQGGYECSCHHGYQLGADDATCEDIDECLIDNGNCTHICENLQGSYSCKCEENYILERDNHTCRIIDPCLEDNGGCSHHCVNQNGKAICKCPKGYVLEEKDCYLHDPCITNNGGCSHICVNANNEVRCECPENFQLMNTTTCARINLCTINNGNCSHFCEFVDDRVNCMCPELYVLENETNCVEVNPCLMDNGGCSHVCSFENHIQTCSCPDSHILHNKTHCFEKNPCLVDNGGCSDLCNYSNGSMTCSCPKNYYLEGKTCYKIDPCLKENGGCSHFCFTDENNNVKCQCPDKYFLKDNKICEPQDPCLIKNGNCSHNCNAKNAKLCSCPNGYRLINETHCEPFNPCSINNGGCSDICENISGKVKCSCPVNYQLDESNNCVVIDPCLEDNGGCSHYCEYLDEEVICSCPDRYNLVNETTCLKVSACLINNGGCSHDCSTDHKNNIKCSCPKGYELEAKTCVPINPCNTKNGGCSHTCTNVDGKVVCKCPPDYELRDKTCFRTNPCAVNNGGCSHGCSNNNGEAKCSCPPGYKLIGKICMDQDPCEKNNGGCSHYCHSKEGKRHCSCPPGYLLRPNKRICKEINECRINRGGCSHGCRNLPGSYECTCPKGFQLDNLKNKTCIDIDECLNNNGGCEMICRNFKGGFKCDCPEGYLLQRDKRSCRMSKVALCRIPQAPTNGVIRCWDGNLDSGSFVPAGTKCNVWCNEGYKLMGESQRVCGESGTWGNNEPQCLVATCPKLPSIQNGWYLPGVCNSGRTYIGESCSIYCRKGFTVRTEIDKFVCDPNMNWLPLVRPDALYNACTKMPDQVNITCPKSGKIDFVLPQGGKYMHVKLPRPDTNVDWSFVTSQPSWGTQLETTLPAGRTEVRFIASSPTDFNITSSCRLVINIMDKEAPYMTDCPHNIERRLAMGESTQIIYWKEPMFYDNVDVVNVYKTREPGSEFGAGLHHITYIASDEAGNRAFCHFSIDVRDDLDNNDNSNAIEQYSSATYTSHRTAGRYKAVLICPNGVQFTADNPDRYNNMITRGTGCYWKHVKVPNPIENQNHQLPRVYSQSRLPASARGNRRVFFKWNR